MNRPDHIMLLDHVIPLELSDRACRAMQALSLPVHIDMELYYSCLIGKRVNVLPVPPPHSVAVASLSTKMTIGFRAVATRTCRVGDQTHALEAEVIPLPRAERYLPKWLRLDYADGSFCGEFGV